MLLCDDGLNDVSEIVEVWKGFHAEDYVVEGDILVGRFLGRLNDWRDG